ncbi:MAG: beta-ketoacyl-[acyl-carrier-protein] synthase II [Planctomycetes bacterium]|nr:beta-ketoacyl-[acyl-carrier-protein] synthase II [Planctomycetota bacterium]
MSRRVVVTGLGALTPIGTGIPKYWQGLLDGHSGANVIEAFDTEAFSVHIGAEVKDFDAAEYLGAKAARTLDRFTQFALAAADESVADSGLDFEKEDVSRAGCIWASGIGGLIEIEATHHLYLDRGPRRISPFFIPKLMLNAACGQIAIRFSIEGVNFAVASACASAQHAIGLAFRSIKYGESDIMITGGSEAAITPLSLGGFCSLRALSTRNDDPATASRPFTLDRDGFLMGEGSGALVLEELEHARARGARIYCEALGLGMTDDGHHISAPVPEGTNATRAMSMALAEAGRNPDEVQYVNAHGTSTPLNDVMETRAIRTAFGEHADKLMVSSTKSQVGHLLGASGAVESVACCLALSHQVVLPTINYQTPDPECDLDYVPNEPRETAIDNLITNSFGFGGHNVAMAFGKI